MYFINIYVLYYLLLTGGAVLSRGCSCLNCTNQAAGAS